MRNEIPIAYYLKQLEIKKKWITKFKQIPNTRESFQMTSCSHFLG